jgi:hypothetical protein
MKRYLLLILSFLTIAGTTAFAQGGGGGTSIDLDYVREPLYFGITVGYNRAMHTVELPSIADNLCPTFPEGSDNGFYVGINYEHIFGNKANSKHGLIVRALYSTYPSVTNVGGAEYPSRFPKYVNGELQEDNYVTSSTEHNIEIDYAVASIELCYKLKPINGFNLGITVGPTIDYALVADWNQSFDLIKPVDAQFKHQDENGNPLRFDPTPEDKGNGDDYVIADYANRKDNPGRVYWSEDYRSLMIHDGEIDEKTAIRIGLKVGLQYEMNLKNGFILVPAVYYNMGLTNLSPDFDWRVNALQMGVDIRYPIRF